MTFIEEVVARLVAQGVGVLGTSLVVSSKSLIPAGDGPIVSLTETGGSGPQFVQNSSTAAVQRPTVQVVARASTYLAAAAKARAAYDALLLYNTSLSGTRYKRLLPLQEPFDMGLDAAGRPMVAFNVMAERQPS